MVREVREEIGVVVDDARRLPGRSEIAGLRVAHPSFGGLVAEALDALGGSGGG